LTQNLEENIYIRNIIIEEIVCQVGYLT